MTGVNWVHRYALVSKQCRRDTIAAHLPQARIAVLSRPFFSALLETRAHAYPIPSVLMLLRNLEKHQHAFGRQRCTLKLTQHAGARAPLRPRRTS